MDEIIKILIVETDNDIQRAILNTLSENATACFEVKFAAQLSETLDVLTGNTFDLVLLDLNLPDSSGINTLKSVRSAVPITPVIVLVELSDVAYVKNMCGETLIRYVTKESGFIDKLPINICQVVHMMHKMELEQGNRKFRTYFDCAPDGIFIVDYSGQIVDMNIAACVISGYSRDELLTMHTIDFIAEESKNDAAEHLTKTVTFGNAVADLWYVTKNGEKRCFTIKAVKVSDTELLGFCRDITIRKQMELSLRESEARFRAIAENSQDAIGILNESSMFIWINNRFIEILGYSYDEIIRNDLFQQRLSSESADFVKESIRKFFEGKHYERHYCFSFFNKNNQLYYAEMFMTDYVDKLGKKNLVIHFHDITERKLVDEKVRMQLQELLRWQDVILGREARIIELKGEVNDLCQRFGQPSRYNMNISG
jgi:PAS domain S-box-containing protein